MIQRIQSLFILAYMIFISVLLFSNVIEIVASKNTFLLNTWYLAYDTTQGCSCEEAEFYPYFLGGVMQIISLFSAALAFFSYRNRKKQLGLLNLTVYFLALEWLIIAYFILKLGYLSDDNEHIKVGVGLFLLFVSPFLIFVAKHFVRKDELTVQSSNRFI